MNERKLQQKLENKTQQIIEGTKCKCGDDIVYILINRGSAIHPLEYVECSLPRIVIFTQDGKTHRGYRCHEMTCKLLNTKDK